MSKEFEIACELAMESEGFNPKRYLCPANKVTQGYGRNLEALPLSTKEEAELVDGLVSKEIAKRWLREEMSNVEVKIMSNQVYKMLNEVRRAVLLDMAYNMGVDGLYEFKRMFQALRGADYALASREMKDSKWYLEVGNRSKRNVLLMAKGTL